MPDSTALQDDLCPSGGPVSFSEVDRILLQRCIDGAPRAWQDFVDRFLGLVIHVVNHTAAAKGIQLDDATRDDLVSEVFLTLLAGDRGVLRRFRRNSSLATYLTVVARRVIVRRLHSITQQRAGQAAMSPTLSVTGAEPSGSGAPQTRLENREEVERLMAQLDPQEANIVRMYHLEGKTYEEISQVSGLSQNSIGPVLSRARQKMREGA
jgi:RNA polymerase sigma-70 factor (ECF subfamily)